MITVLLVCALSTLLLLGLSVFSCTNIQAFVWPGSVRCDEAPPAVVVAAVDDVLRRDGLVGELSSASVNALEDVAREFGADATVCALVQLRDQYAGPPGVMPPGEDIARAARAHGFLGSRHIAIVRGAP